ncbi:MAG: hypothetical protein AAGC55_16550, partial [Myxococcota bacterium]
ARGVAHSREEKTYGLDRRLDAARIKLDAVVERHPDFFQALARFLAAGNRIEIVAGNHDTEFCWPEVQQAFCDGVVRTWRTMPEASRPGARGADDLRAAIGFHVWFYYEPGVAWIEHGHQYDECCSFEYNLNPADTSGQTIISNVDSAAVRYVTNQIADVNPHGTDEWSMGGYLRLAAGMGWRGAVDLACGYYRFAATLISEWRAARIGHERRQRRAVHHERLRALSETTPLSLSALRDLDAIQRPPVITNLRRLMKVLMLDKLLVGITSLLLIVTAFAALPLYLAALATVAVTVGARMSSAWLSRGRNVDSSVPLEIVPSRILEHVDARFVVFGHTHIAVAQPLDARLPADDPGQRWYYNTGTWIPNGKPGFLHAFTHVMIRHTANGPVGTLCQWRDRASRAFTPGWTPSLGAPTMEPTPALGTPTTAAAAASADEESGSDFGESQARAA